jgi:hypothetical protein
MIATKNKFKISLYWKCQLLGWGTMSIFWAYNTIIRDEYSIFYGLLNYVADIVFSITLTHLYRNFALKLHWNDLPLKQLLWRVIPTIFFLGTLFMLVMNFKWYFYWTLVRGREIGFLYSLFFWNPVFITGLRMMSIWLLAYHLYHYYQKEIKTTKENARLSVIAKQAQLDNLSAQLNPHFLFNSLNSIKSLVIEDPKIARRAIDLLSDLLRSSLYQKEQKLITIKDELALVRDYIELEKIRFEERLITIFTIDEELTKYKIPLLSIQLLVENAIKHGVDKRIEATEVEISVQKATTENIKITVQNQGELAAQNHVTGLGLKNLRERLLIQYKGKASFEIKESSNNKVVTIITIPITYYSDENI